MAIFNPEVRPGRDDMPNWQKSVGQPISDLTPDKSAGLALSTAGTAVEGAASVADTAIKQGIDKDVRTSTETIRDDFTKELETARAAQLGQSDPSLTLTPNKSEPTVPDAIKTGLSKVDSIQSALSNGKINDTYYDLRLKNAVLDLRQRYPGYVDYIDQKVSQITGINPANAYVQNLMQDINRAQTTKRTETDKAVDDAMKSGYPNSDTMIKQLQAKGPDFLPTFRQWYSEQTMLDAGVKRREALRQAYKGSKEDLNIQRTEDWTNEVGSAVSSNLNTMVTVSGLNKPQNILQMIEEGASNPGKYTEEQFKQLGTQLLAQKSVLERQLQARLTQTAKDASGNTYSYASDVGASKAQEIIKNQLSIYDTMINALHNNNAGLAFYAANHAKAILDQNQDNLLSDKDIGSWSAKMTTFNTNFGPNWTNLVTNQALRSKIDDKMRSYLDNNMLDARLGTGVTMKEHMDEAKRLEDQGRITSAMRSRYINNLVNIVDDIKNKDAPDGDKINVLKYLFSPKGQDILNGIKTDYTDPSTGKFVPGKYAVFNRLTSEDVVKEVSRLSKSDPQIGQMYKTYMEREAGSNLFYKELQNLNSFTGHDNLHFKYNDGANGGVPSVELIDNKGALVSPVGQDSRTYSQRPPAENYIYQVNQILNRLNTGLAGMARVENGLGGNPSEYILQFMMKSQVDLGKNWEGLPAKLVDAIAASRAPARRIEDTFEDAGMKKRK